ncbi:MAG TPA: hypothetical protein VGF81_02355 [Solirubrobacteraceae bacterium]
MASASFGAPAPPASSAPVVKLRASGKTLEIVSVGTQVHVRAVESGTVPAAEQPAKLEILGGYAVHGQTQAHLLKKCDGTRCEIDPSIRTAVTWTYQAFVFGHDGVELAKSKMVKVRWVRRGSAAIAP